MTRLDSPRLVTYAGLAALGLLAGLVLGRIELVALAAPFALAAVAGGALARDPRIEANLVLDRDRALEGDEVRVSPRMVQVVSSTFALRRLSSPSPLVARFHTHPYS